MIDSHLVDLHEGTAHNPTAWYYCAETFLESADHIRLRLEAADRDRILERAGHMDTHYSTCDLLLGYAIECILKGIWVKNGNTLVEDGRLKRNAIPEADAHELGQIARSVGANVSRDELSVLDRLSASSSLLAATRFRSGLTISSQEMCRAGERCIQAFSVLMISGSREEQPPASPTFQAGRVGLNSHDHNSPPSPDRS